MKAAISFILISLITLTLLGAFLQKVYDLDLVSSRSSDRVTLLAVPTCISEKYFGKKIDYTAYGEVYDIASNNRYMIRPH